MQGYSRLLGRGGVYMDEMIGEVQTYVTKSDISPEDIELPSKIARSKYLEKTMKIDKLFTMDESLMLKNKIHSESFCELNQMIPSKYLTKKKVAHELDIATSLMSMAKRTRVDFCW